MILFYLLIAIMPFERKGATVGNFTYAKYVGLACIVVAIIDLARRRSSPRFFSTPQSKWLVLFLLMTTFSFLINGAGLQIEMSNVVSYWSFLILFLLTVTLINNTRRLYWSLMAAVGGVAWFAQYMIREWRYGFRQYGAAYRPGAMTGDSNYFGVNIVLVLPIVLILLSTATKWWQKAFCFGCMCLLIGSTVVGASRGTLLGMIVGCGYLILHSKNRKRNVGIILGLLIPALIFSPVSPLKRLINPTKSDVEASDNRLYGWKAGARMVADHPLIGVGLGNYKTVGPQYDPTGHLAKEPHIAHNAYLEIVAEMGIPMFLIFVTLLITTFRSLTLTRRRALANGPESVAAMTLALKAGLMGACVAIFFVSGQYQKLLWLAIFLTMCLPALVNKTAKAKRGVLIDREAPAFVGNPMLWDELELRSRSIPDESGTEIPEPDFRKG